jgi:hypothetical protein
MNNIVYTTKEVALQLHYSVRYITLLCKTKRILGVYQITDAGKWQIPEEGLISFINKKTKVSTDTSEEIQPQVITSQPYQMSLHKQRILEMVGNLDSEINLPEISDSFFYYSHNQRTIIRSIPQIIVDKSGKISVPVSIDTDTEMDSIHTGLRSHLETGGFSEVSVDIHNWKVGIGHYLERCHNLLEMVTVKEQNTVDFRDKVERHKAVGYKKNFYISACADAIDVAMKTIDPNPLVTDEKEISELNYHTQMITNGLWLLIRYGFGGIYVAKSERQAKSYLRNHWALMTWLLENEGIKEITKIRTELNTLSNKIKKQLERFQEMEQVPGYCELCTSK